MFYSNLCYHLLSAYGRIQTSRFLNRRIHFVLCWACCVLALLFKANKILLWNRLKVVLNNLGIVYSDCYYFHCKNHLSDILDKRDWTKELIFKTFLQFNLCIFATFEWHKSWRNVIRFLVLYCWYNFLIINMLNLFNGSS